jgi:hypothetical protein
MAVLVAATAGTVAFFAKEILLVWTRDVDVAGRSAPIATVLVIGMALNALMSLPYALQLAHGWTGLGLRINLSLLILLVPATYLMTVRFGPVGAAGAWVLLNGLYMLVGVPLMHRRLLPGHMGAWFRSDILPPLVAAVAVLGAGRMAIATNWSAPWTVLAVGFMYIGAAAAGGAAAPLVRQALRDLLGQRSTLRGRGT